MKLFTRRFVASFFYLSVVMLSAVLSGFMYNEMSSFERRKNEYDFSFDYRFSRFMYFSRGNCPPGSVRFRFLENYRINFP